MKIETLDAIINSMFKSCEEFHDADDCAPDVRLHLPLIRPMIPHERLTAKQEAEKQVVDLEQCGIVACFGLTQRVVCPQRPLRFTLRLASRRGCHTPTYCCDFRRSPCNVSGHRR